MPLIVTFLVELRLISELKLVYNSNGHLKTEPRVGEDGEVGVEHLVAPPAHVQD